MRWFWDCACILRLSDPGYELIKRSLSVVITNGRGWAASGPLTLNARNIRPSWSPAFHEGDEEGAEHSKKQ